MKLPVIVGSLLVFASTAFAQAPGDYDEDSIAPPSMAPVVAPVVVAPAAQPVRRWSIGLGIGGMDLAPHVAPDSKTQFDIGQLYVRYRPWRHLEIELALGGGHESEKDGVPGYREVSSAVLALRYRFSPQKRWNFFLMAGMGSLAVTHENATSEERDAAFQSTLQFGAGIERRWSRFALQFEVRAVGVAPHDEGDMTTASPPVKTDTTGTMPLPPGSEPTSSPNDGMKGGQFVLSGNYYF